ncbi:MAG: hypothetical protein ABIR11_09410 [Candidatus Limnocylindrales bacterium]
MTAGPVEFERHPGVDAYIGSLPAWQGDICRELRALIHAADPGIRTIKRGTDVQGAGQANEV